MRNPRRRHLMTGLMFELIATQTSISDEGENVFIHLKNITSQPIGDVSITTHDYGLKVEGKFQNHITQIQPYADKTIEVFLQKQQHPKSKDLIIIFDVRYLWFTNPGEKIQGQLFRTLQVKAEKTIEDVIISGIPLSFAEYIIPGLFALIIFGLIAPLPKVISDNEYWVAVPLSVLLLLFLRATLATLHYEFGNLLKDFILYTVVGCCLGLLGGYIFRPSYNRYPANDKMSLRELLATYILQTGSVKAIPTEVIIKDTGTFLGLIVKTSGAKEVILLPPQYRLSNLGGSNVKKMIDALQNREASCLGKCIRGVAAFFKININTHKTARLLKKLSDSDIEVINGYEKKKDDESWEKPTNGNLPMKNIPMAGITSMVNKDEKNLIEIT